MSTTRTKALPLGNRLWQSCLLAAGLVLFFHLALTITLRDDQALLANVGNLLSFAETTAAAVALGLIAWRARDLDRSSVLGWTFLALALFVTAMGDATWWLIQKSEGQVPFPSAADIPYFAFYPLFAIGLILLPAMPHTPGQRLRFGLDTTSALLAGVVLFWVFGMAPLVARTGVGGLELAAALAYPAGDLALLAGLLLLLNRRVTAESRTPLRLLAVGTVVMLVSDSLFSYQAVAESYVSGGFLDLGFTLTYLLFALAAVRALTTMEGAAASASAPAEDERAGGRIISWGVALPYGAMLFAFALLAWDHFHPTGIDFPVLVIVLAGIVVLLAARQFMAVLENDTLQKNQRELNERLLRAQAELEARVDERTEALREANAALAAEVSQHERAEAQLRASLREKEALVREVHHRVKNNLQVVYSLFSLQSYMSEGHSVADVLLEGQSRVKAMSLIHEMLYASPDLARIDFANYLRTLSRHLYNTYRPDDSEIGLQVQAIEMWLDLDVAVPCGLIVNELLSNALKHAFRDRVSGAIGVELAQAGDTDVRLTVADDGIGLPPELDWRYPTTLGLQLALMLTRQLGGRLEVDCAGGTRFDITFPPAE